MKRNITYGISLISILLFLYFGGCSLRYIEKDKIDINSNTDLFKKAISLVEEKRYDNALEYLDRIDRASPLFSISLMKKVKIHYKLGYYHRAYSDLTDFRKNLVTYPYLKDFYYYYFFKIHFRQNNYDSVISNSFFIENVYENSIKKNLKLLLAKSYYKKKNYKESYRILINLYDKKNNYKNKNEIKNYLWRIVNKRKNLLSKKGLRFLKHFIESNPKKIKNLLFENSEYKSEALWWEIYYKIRSYNQIVHNKNLSNGIYIKKYSTLIKNKKRRQKYLEKFINKKNINFHNELIYYYLINYHNKKSEDILFKNYNNFDKNQTINLFDKYFRFFLRNKKYKSLNKLLSGYVKNNFSILHESDKAKIYYWKGYLKKYYLNNKRDYREYFKKAIDIYPLSYYYFKSLEELNLDYLSFTENNNYIKNYSYDENDNFTKVAAILLEMNDYKTLKFIQKFISDKFLLDNCYYFLKSYENNHKYKRSIVNAYYLRKKFGNYKRLLKYNYPVKYKSIIDKILTKYSNFDIPTYLALIHQESHFEKKAVSSAGARGLIQIMPYTAERIYNIMQIEEKIDLFNPNLNLNLGIFYLYTQYQRFNHKIFSLAAYNAGPNRVSRWKNRYNDRKIEEFIELIPFNETQNYVKLIYAKEKIYTLLLSI